MVLININVLDLCMAFIEHGRHISTAEKYLNDNFNLTETQFTCVKVNIQKSILPKFNARWIAASRKKDRFIQDNQEWLNSEYTVDFDNTENSGNQKRGRPCKDYAESSEKTKKRKATQLIRHSGIDHVEYSLIQGLRSIGETSWANLIEKIRQLPDDSKKSLLTRVESNLEDPISLSNDEALALFIDVNLSRSKYQLIKNIFDEKNCKILPSYKNIVGAKNECYPKSITITDVRASVSLQNLLDHTTNRIIKIDSVDVSTSTEYKLYVKWGCDGSSGQAEYKQILAEETDKISDSNLFIASIVPLKLIDTNNNITVWKNKSPSSNRFCRPLFIEFSKETPEKTRQSVSDIEQEISNLSPTRCVISEHQVISVKYEMIFTMIDGKVVQVISETPSSSTCPICLAKPTEMNNLDLLRNKQDRIETYRFGLSTLHCWIRFMEAVLHIAYNLDFMKWSARNEEEKDSKIRRKADIQTKFREELGLIIDKPRQGSGNYHDGNTARRFFANYSCSSRITGVKEELIKRFYIILQTMASGKPIDSKKFGDYARQTAEYYIENYGWYYMPVSVHKVLIHGANIIEYHSILPLGQLSEDAQEARNKDYKSYRLNHSRKCSRTSTNEDVMHTLLYTSDPYITSKSIIKTRKIIDLDEEAKELLQLEEEE